MSEKIEEKKLREQAQINKLENIWTKRIYQMWIICRNDWR